jgi:hypothetical protein
MKTHIFLFVGSAAQKIGSSVDGRGAATSNSNAFGNLPRVGVCAEDLTVRSFTPVITMAEFEMCRKQRYPNGTFRASPTME